MPLTFPQTELGVTVELAFGADLTADPGTWTWTDITALVLTRTNITIGVGRANEAGQDEPSAMDTLWRNVAGVLTRRNPLSPYYGTFNRNTPCRISANPGTGDVVRGSGYVTGAPPRWDKSGADQTIAARPAGILRRLGQGRSPLVTSLSRTILASGPAAYWPMEDGADATTLASGLPAGAPLIPVNGLVLAEVPGPAGSGALPSFATGGGATGVSPTVTTTWRVELIVKAPTLSPGTLAEWVQWGDENNLTNFWSIGTESSAGAGVFLAYPMGVGVGIGAVITNFSIDDSEWHHIRVDAEPNGAQADITITIDGVVRAAATTTSLVAGGLLTNPLSLNTTLQDDSGDYWSVGHLAIWSTAPGGTVDSAGAMTAHTGEAAGDRIQRLCDERGIPITIDAGDTTPMGPQPDATVLALLRECEAADGGVLGESGFGLRYAPRVGRYNAAVDMALDYEQGHISGIVPEDDDQLIRNIWTVSRTDGSTATATDPVSVAAEGEYDDSVTLNVLADSQLPHEAAWRVHLGTGVELRYPKVVLDLAANPGLIADWVACQTGSRITIANPPADVPPDPIDLIVEGWTETLGPYTWRVELNCSPARPYEVWQVEGDRLGRLGLTDSTLDSSATSSATSLSVATATLPLLITTATRAADFPFDIAVGGERMTVTAITGTSSPQTVTVTRSVNGVAKAHSAGAAVELWRPGVIAL